MIGNLKRAAIKKLSLVLEAYNIHLLNSDNYFELIVKNGRSKLVTPHLKVFLWMSHQVGQTNSHG